MRREQHVANQCHIKHFIVSSAVLYDGCHFRQNLYSTIKFTIPLLRLLLSLLLLSLYTTVHYTVVYTYSNTMLCFKLNDLFKKVLIIRQAKPNMRARRPLDSIASSRMRKRNFAGIQL